MDRKVKVIKLTDYEVDIITTLTWGEKEKIQNSLLKGAKFNAEGAADFNSDAVLESKYIAMESCIKEIRDKDKAKLPFSKDWVNNLSIEDGDKLYFEIDSIGKKK